MYRPDDWVDQVGKTREVFTAKRWIRLPTQHRLNWIVIMGNKHIYDLRQPTPMPWVYDGDLKEGFHRFGDDIY